MPSDARVADVTTLSNDPVVNEAIKRFRKGMEWEANAREHFVDDYKFAEGDADNGYQWPAAVKRNRDVEKRPCLTLNITRQHNLQIVNEAKKNKACVRVRAIGNGATKDSADLYSALIRQIEYKSNAQSVYATAAHFQVKGGIGWFRLKTDYVSKDTFDQEILFERIIDPLSVLMDPDCKQEDGSDAKWAFVFDQIPVDQFDDLFPEYQDKAGISPLGTGSSADSDWISKDYVRVAEYFRKVSKPDILVSFIDPNDGLRKSLRKSKMPPGLFDRLKTDKMTKTRQVDDEVIEWKLIAGETVIDETIWPGAFIPLVKMIGEETIIDGILDRKGHTRAMKDAQRMYNYNASAQVEFVALQSKTPYIASAKAIEEYESMWNSANMVNHSVLIYNDIDQDFPDRPIPPPQRQQPPTSAPGFEQGMQTAFNQMMMTSGQWQNQMGMMGNERTGAAIQKRQEQSDTSVFHFQDNYGAALRYAGKLAIDLIPKVYDKKRLMKLRAEDGEDLDVEMDPQAAQAYMQQVGMDGEIVKRVLNPLIGQYDVEADVGAAYGTRRQETVEAMTLILTQAPALTGIIGDLLMRAMDFREAQEAAARLKRMIPPQALGKGPSPNEMALQQQLQTTQQALAKALERYAKDTLKLAGKEQMRDIDAYKAHTDRVKALAAMLPTDPNVMDMLIKELGDDTLSETLRPIYESNRKGLQAEAQDTDTAGETGEYAPGVTKESLERAKSGPPQGGQSGEWYLTDPTRRGRFMRIAPLAQEHQPKGIISNA